MFIREELSKIDSKIQNLEQQKKIIVQKFIHERNEKDKKTIIENYDMLMHLYNSKHPELYDRIIISCFPIRTHICCGCGGSMDRLTLSMLLKLWSNGYTYEGKPIINITTTNSGRKWMDYIEKDGTIGHLSNSDGRKNDEIIQRYEGIPHKLFGSIPAIKEKYSEVGISDIISMKKIHLLD